jgi:hypothetical protein
VNGFPAPFLAAERCATRLRAQRCVSFERETNMKTLHIFLALFELIIAICED